MNNILLSIKLFLCILGSNPVFIIEVKNSLVRYVKGDKNFKFLKDCEDIVCENKISNGLIYATKNSDGKTRIRTTSEISVDAAQRFRNVWSFYS